MALGMARSRTDIPVRSLTAVLIIGGVRYEKSFPVGTVYEGKWPITWMKEWVNDFRPSDREMGNKKWLRQNGWRKRK